jgi:hypothetical protein
MKWLPKSLVASGFSRKIRPISTMRMRLAWMALTLNMFAASAPAQTRPTGDVTIMADHLPNRNRTSELRARVFAEEVIDPSPRLVFTLSGFVEGLLAGRGVERPPGRTDVSTAIVRVQEASARFTSPRFDLLAGFSRVVWGRLDEVQPTDVVNPLDVSRFFFEGRSEARLPVGLIRARVFLSEGASIEGVYVPFHRRGRFDQLDEPTSPFNIEPRFAPAPVACLETVSKPLVASGFSRTMAVLKPLLAIGCPSVLPIAIERREPPAAFHNGQGGARFSATTGRLDWSVSAYRGFEPFGFGASPQAAVVPVHIVYPRFTMIGGDVETVRGPWGLRGEVAAFVDDNFQQAVPGVVGGNSIDAGIGLDRKAGDYRVSGSILAHRESYDEPIVRIDGPQRARSEVSLILSADRSFAAERYQVRTFGVYNATGSSAFLRGIATAKLRDNVSLEGSAGWFAGEGGTVIGRFGDSDFGYVRVKYYF